MITLTTRINSVLYLLLGACPFAWLAACTESISEELGSIGGVTGTAGVAGNSAFVAAGVVPLGAAGTAGDVQSPSTQQMASGGAPAVASAPPATSAFGKTGAAGRPTLAAEAGAAGLESKTACVATTDNEAPDPNGEDSNCDGIDGTVTRSVFVSPDGLDSAMGTLDDPVRTVGKAVTLAQSSGGERPDVLIGAASYPENVLVSGAALSLHGGYDCSTWKRTASKPLVTEPLSVSRLSFKAPYAIGFGESSHGAQITNSNRVRIEQSIIVAGRGGLGATGKVQVLTWDGTKPLDAARGEDFEVVADGSLGCHSDDENIDVGFDGNLDFTSDDLSSKRCISRMGAMGLIIRGANAAPTNLDANLTGLEDIVLEVTHEARPTKGPQWSTLDLSCLGQVT